MPEEDDKLANDRLALPGLWASVQAADGSEFWHWSQARLLCGIAERRLGPYFFQADSAEEDDVLRELAELQERLAQNDGFATPRRLADWYQVRAQLARVMPLLQRLLA
ncbi:MAG TPA: hypothetical protein VF630_14215 [Hymenobacter sp.]